MRKFLFYSCSLVIFLAAISVNLDVTKKLSLTSTKACAAINQGDEGCRPCPPGSTYRGPNHPVDVPPQDDPMNHWDVEDSNGDGKRDSNDGGTITFSGGVVIIPGGQGSRISDNFIDGANGQGALITGCVKKTPIAGSNQFTYEFTCVESFNLEG
ncbi:MAG: hypothetical protein A2787_03490 [Omnitrophica WOR_2 bacterium RIFCSPHIGHO2_01_FULL_48_9]|nr:MAG: hypothetical protein A2787_03490 [Omnitrophica WOR_2 bacterium RIFCSPHIGHO2_01_FULL_48_9]